jgi:AcrR family transcriptional regulator
VSTRERTDQKRRTRRDLLRAATRLMKAGRVPTLAEVADEALVSRATAYRYFSSEEALLAEATLDVQVPTPDALFDGEPSVDPVERLLKANAALREMAWGNETQLKLWLSRLLEKTASAAEAPGVPRRQNRRVELIDAALAPTRDRLDDDVYRRLRAALSLVLGAESMVVFRDVLQMESDAAHDVEQWVVRTLTEAALAESDATRRASSNPQSTNARAPRTRASS